jgi:16S rRNA (guanine527-N7)-methyltransferase
LSGDWNALREWTADQIGLVLSSPQLDQLRSHVDALLFWNRKLALVSQSDPAEIINRHVADSLAAASRCVNGEAIIDLGSGAGFPGLPIAVVLPASRVCMVESRGKKASFLEEARRAASARNAVIYHARIEAAAADPAHRAQYAVVTARALTSTIAFLAYARPFLVSGGRAIAMRAVAEAPLAGPLAIEEMRYELPDGTPRRLLIVRP